MGGKPNHTKSLMSVYGLCMQRNKNNSTHKSPGYHLLFKKMSGFNNSETAHVTFSPMSINASKKKKLLWPAFYLKQHGVGQEVLPMQSCQRLVCSFCWCTQKLSIWISYIVLKVVIDEGNINNSHISSAPVLYDGWKLHNLSLHHPSVSYSEFCALAFCAHSSHRHSLSHATNWVLWIAFLSVR